MNDSDNPLSKDEAASTGEESRPEPSIVRSVSSWLVRAFARNGDATWQESLEELIEEEEDISVYLRVVCKAKSMYVRTLYERAFSNWKNVGDVFKRSRRYRHHFYARDFR